jgi:hypothetical protein
MIGCDKPNNNDGNNEKKEYASLFHDISTDLWRMTGHVKPEIAPFSSFALKNKIETDSQEVTDPETIIAIKSQINNMNAIVELIANLYGNDNFIVSDKPLTFTGDVTLLGMTNTYTMTLLPLLDKENDIIYLDWYSECPMIGLDNNPIMKEYDYVEIEYDFDNRNVLSFRFLTKRGYSDEYTAYQEYGLTSEGKVYMSKNSISENFQNIVDNITNTFLTLKQTDEIVLTAGVFNEELQIYAQTLMDIIQYS